MYSRQTPVSTQLGGKATTVFSGDVSSTWQHSNRGTPLKKKSTNNATNARIKTQNLREFFNLNEVLATSGGHDNRSAELPACMGAFY